MDKIKKYIFKKRYILLFVLVLFVFGLVVGLFLSIHNIDYLREDVVYYAKNIANQSYNYMFIHFFLLVVSLVLSFFAVGIPLICTILFYEGLTTGFLIGLFSSMYQFGGFIFSWIFIFVTKLGYVVLLLFFFFKCLEIARKMIGKYIYKTDPSIILVHLLKASACFILFIFLHDFLVYSLASKVLPFFHFLLT